MVGERFPDRPGAGALIEDSLGICAGLEAQMERHVAAYRDEWQAVLDDPEVSLPVLPVPTT